MDRNIVYPGSIPQDADILDINRNVMVALGYLIQATVGSATVVDGLACAPAGAALAVTVGPGCITLATSIDATTYGSLAADTTDPLVKMGINPSATVLPLSAPGTAGQSQNFLIEAAFSESDTGPVTLPYVNAANPLEPYSGPGNSGAAQNTARVQRVSLQAKPGVAAATGTQTTPLPDSGYVGLYAVTVANGQSSLAGANIVALAGTPVLGFKLPQLSPGVSRMAVLSANGSWTVPIGVTLIHARCSGGGGAGGGGAGYAGGGGAGGGFVEAFFTVVPGAVLGVTIGAGGVAGVAGGAGGTTALGGLATATGGGGGAGGSSSGGAGSTVPGLGNAAGANGAPRLQTGVPGGNGVSIGSGLISGAGGGADGRTGAGFVGGPSSANIAGASLSFPGAGGSGGLGTGAGGTGAAGLVVIAW